MIRISILTAIIISIAGCASGSAEVPAQGGVAEPVANDTATTRSTEVSSDSAATDSTADSKGAPDEDIEFMEAPEVEKVAAVTPKRDEMVCKRVRMTGSHRLEKICRPRSEIESTMRETHRALRDMERRSAKKASN